MTVEWEEARRSILERESARRDLLVAPGDIHWRSTGGLLAAQIDNLGQFFLSPWAEAQLCRWLGIPVRYFRECPAELQRMQVNFLVKRRPSCKKEWLIRTRRKIIRAFLSGHYQPFDNDRVVSLWESAGDPDRFDYEVMLDDTFMFLRALVRNGLDRGERMGGILKGAFIRNSEVGRSALAAGTSVYRLVCKNGLVAYVGDAPLLYQRHIYVDETALAEKLKSTMAGAYELGSSTVRRMEEAQKVPVSLGDLMERLDEFKLKDETRREVIDYFSAEGDNSMFGLVNALTAAARGLPPHDRYKLEVSAGSVLAEVSLN